MITLLSVCSISAGSLAKADGWWVWICLCCMILSRSDRPADRSRLCYSVYLTMPHTGMLFGVKYL